MLKILTILITTSFSLSFCDSILSTKYDVEILRDTWGVPHIYGITDKDVAFGFAFALLLRSVLLVMLLVFLLIWLLLFKTMLLIFLWLWRYSCSRFLR